MMMMLMTFMIMMMMLMIFMIMMMMLMTFMIMMMMLMIFMIMMMITKIIMITMRSKRKKGGGVGEGSFFLTDLSISNRKQLKLDQRTAHICRFLVKVTRISVSRCTRLK